MVLCSVCDFKCIHGDTVHILAKETVFSHHDENGEIEVGLENLLEVTHMPLLYD